MVLRARCSKRRTSQEENKQKWPYPHEVVSVRVVTILATISSVESIDFARPLASFGSALTAGFQTNPAAVLGRTSRAATLAAQDVAEVI